MLVRAKNLLIDDDIGAPQLSRDDFESCTQLIAPKQQNLSYISAIVPAEAARSVSRIGRIAQVTVSGVTTDRKLSLELGVRCIRPGRGAHHGEETGV